MSVNERGSTTKNQPAIVESTQTVATKIINQDIKSDKSSSPKVQPALESNQTPTLNTTNNDTATDESIKSAPTPIPDSVSDPLATKVADNHENSSPPEAQPTFTPETSTTQIPDSDANKTSTPISTQSPPPEVQPTTTHETSPPQGPPTTHDSTETSTTKIPDQDANKNETDHDFDDLGTSSSPKFKPSNQESTSTDPPVANGDPPKTAPEIQPATDQPAQTVPPDSQTNNDTTPAAPTAEQERTQLVNLIYQEIDFLNSIWPKLGKHQEHIKKKAEEFSNTHKKLKDEPCDLKELKDLKKTITKLKLQIPAKYRTYDKNDPQKNQQSDGTAGNLGAISAMLQKQNPQLVDKLFHDSPFCKTIEQRYNKLTTELKLCVLCFSVFPENAIISRRLMVYWWIGEGLVPPEDKIEVGSTAEDIANKNFNVLISKDFIEPISRKHGRNVATCRMHPLVRAALVMIAEKEKFFDFDVYGNPKDFGKYDEIEIPEDMPVIYPLGDPKEFFIFYEPVNGKLQESTDQNIAFVDSKGDPSYPTPFAEHDQNQNQNQTPNPVDQNEKLIDTNKKRYFYLKRKEITTQSYRVCLMGSGLSKGLPWEKLHMLFNVKDDILEFKPEWFQRMRNISVVFLGRWQSSATHHIEVEDFKFEESLEHMNHLKFFSLQGVSRISELPKTISKLKNLLILDLRACHSLEIIPKTIGSLKCLTHLDMSECYLLEHMPKEISLLESLQVLKGFIVSDTQARHACTLHDLSKLENLKKLSMYTHMKDFPQESHADSLQKFKMLRKLTIAWGGHESKNKTNKPVVEAPSEKKDNNNLASKVKKLIPNKKQWVKGSLRRMNAFNNSTLGSRLEKLDLKCFPESLTPGWLTPGHLEGLKKLYIRGGHFSDLGQFQDVFDWGTDNIPIKKTWNVEVLRLKYLDEVEMDWRELQSLFPKLNSLEKVKCPKLTLFPCDESGVWTKKTTMTNTG